MGEVTDNFLETSYQPVKPKGWGCRHTLTFLGFLGFTFLYGMRVNLNLTIVTMVKQRNLTLTSSEWIPRNITLTSPALPLENTSIDTKQNESMMTLLSTAKPKRILISRSGLVLSSHESLITTSSPFHTLDNEIIRSEIETADDDDNGKFDWDEKTQGLILGSYGLGLFSKIPGGLIASRIGGRWLLIIAIFGASLMTLLTPMMAAIDWRLLMAARAVQEKVLSHDFMKGCCSPSMHTLLGKWLPANERSSHATIIYAGGQLGTAITLISIGFLTEAKFLGDWQGIFYILGSLSMIWSILFFAFISESPETSGRISTEELVYIQKSINSAVSSKQNHNSSSRSVPWKEMLTSLPVWAIIVANTADSWGFYTFLTTLPSYLKTVLQFDIKSNSWLSALPYLVSWGFSVILTQFADYLVSSGKVSSIIVRKSCETIGHLGSAICLTFCAFYAGTTSRAFIVTLLVIGISINGATYGGYAVNHIELSPQFAGVLIGVTSTIANICGIIAPSLAGFILNDNPSLESWQLIFVITCAIYIFDTIFYLIFASTTEQPWSREKGQPEQLPTTSANSNNQP